jgi:hypothetical protein
MKEKREISIEHDSGAEKCLNIATGILSDFGVDYEVNAQDLPITVTYYVETEEVK